nr:unnamed protein product [Callosobruchus chinensis]
MQSKFYFKYIKLFLGQIRLMSKSAKSKNHYDSLGITNGSTQGEIKSAYYKLSMVYHPDKNPNDAASSEKFRDITAAYEVLGNIKTRKLYDKGAFTWVQWDIHLQQENLQKNLWTGSINLGKLVLSLLHQLVELQSMTLMNGPSSTMVLHSKGSKQTRKKLGYTKCRGRWNKDLPKQKQFFSFYPCCSLYVCVFHLMLDTIKYHHIKTNKLRL